jgi:hypothetical protein
MNNCGVCNHHLDINHAQLRRFELDGTLTPYHMGCEGEARKLKPCVDCGQHRLLCSDCAEVGEDTQ